MLGVCHYSKNIATGSAYNTSVSADLFQYSLHESHILLRPIILGRQRYCFRIVTNVKVSCVGELYYTTFDGTRKTAVVKQNEYAIEMW